MVSLERKEKREKKTNVQVICKSVIKVKKKQKKYSLVINMVEWNLIFDLPKTSESKH